MCTSELCKVGIIKIQLYCILLCSIYIHWNVITRLNKHVSYISLLNCCSFGFRPNSELLWGLCSIRSRRLVSKTDNTVEKKFSQASVKISIHYPLNMDRNSSWASDEINVFLKTFVFWFLALSVWCRCEGRSQLTIPRCWQILLQVQRLQETDWWLAVYQNLINIKHLFNNSNLKHNNII